MQKLVTVYKIWQEFLRHFPKDLRYTLGAKIDLIFLEVVETIFTAACLTREQKLPYIQRASLKLDTLKFFLQIAWESKALDNKKYINISEPLAEVGRMLGGWQKQVGQK